MVADPRLALADVEGLETVAVEYLVEMEPEGVAVVGDERSEAGLDICVLHVLALEQPVGVRLGDVVEITADDHRALDAVDGAAQDLDIILALLEALVELLAYATLEPVDAFAGVVDRADAGQHARVFFREHERHEMHVDQRQAMAVDVELIESVAFRVERAVDVVVSLFEHHGVFRQDLHVERRVSDDVRVDLAQGVELGLRQPAYEYYGGKHAPKFLQNLYAK